MALPALLAKSKEVVMQDAPASYRDAAALDQAANEAWKQYIKTIPFLGVPPEIHLKIFTFLNPIDAVCLSLIKYVYPLSHDSISG